MSYYAWNCSKSLCWEVGWVVVLKPILVFSLAQAEQFDTRLDIEFDNVSSIYFDNGLNILFDNGLNI